jgi:hypothetical protein
MNGSRYRCLRSAQTERHGRPNQLVCRCGALTSVLGPTASEDRHAARPNKQSGSDQDDAQDQLALDQLHNADHDKDGGDNPQNGRTHGPIHTPASSALFPCCRAAYDRVVCCKMERFFGSVSSPSGRGCPSPRGGHYNRVCHGRDYPEPL